MSSVAAASQRDDRGLARAAITNAADLYVGLRNDQSYPARLFLLAVAARSLLSLAES